MENKKCWLHHCTDKIEKTMNHLEYHLHRWNLPREKSKRKAYSSWSLKKRELDVKFISPNREQRWNLLQCFRQEMRNLKINLRVLFFKHADPSNLGRSLLEGIKDHLLSQARSELMRQEHQVGVLNNCISELQQQAYAQRIKLQDAQHGHIESRRAQIPSTGRIIHEKEKVLRDTQVRSMHEIGEMKRAQEQRVDEVSVQKLRENHETIQKLTSQLQEMQGCKNKWILWMIRANLKKWNQITVGDCLAVPVSLQWFQVLVPCWAATNACLLAHGIHRDYRKTFSVINYSTFDSPRDPPQGVHPCAPQRETRIRSTSHRVGDSCRKRWQTK